MEVVTQCLKISNQKQHISVSVDENIESTKLPVQVRAVLRNDQDDQDDDATLQTDPREMSIGVAFYCLSNVKL